VELGCDHRHLVLLDDVVEEEDALAPRCSQSLISAPLPQLQPATTGCWKLDEKDRCWRAVATTSLHFVVPAKKSLVADSPCW
jgi:hypothetical protein